MNNQPMGFRYAQMVAILTRKHPERSPDEIRELASTILAGEPPKHRTAPPAHPVEVFTRPIPRAVPLCTITEDGVIRH